MKPTVSVAVATWNGAKYLRQQLASIYAQTWCGSGELEVVASDDASTDGTTGILAEYARSHGLRYAVNPLRRGLVQNFGRAISLCHGELIALADQDDLWKPQKIARLVDALGDATLVYCNSQEMLTPDGRIAENTSFANVVDFMRLHGSRAPTRALLAENWVVAHTLLFRRELGMHALPIPPHQSYPDGWLALVASKLGGIRYLDERLQTYRQHAESATYIDPARRRRPPHRLLELLTGRSQAGWRRRCAHETARLSDAAALPLLDTEDREFLADLFAYYSPDRPWQAVKSGWKIAPYVASQHGRPRWKYALRPLF